MKKRIVAVTALTAVVAACGNDSALDGESDPEAVREFLSEAMPDGASGTVLVAGADDIIYCDGFGFADRTAEIEADCDTVYDVMSITKQFTAAAILKLEMLGKLDVDDRIADILGPVPEDKRDITIHHLLTHTAGLVEALGDDYEPLSRDGLLSEALNSGLVSAPGEEHHYSNTGYSVLAAIVEVVSGQTYDEFVVENLFEPAGMTKTGYVRPGWHDDEVAVEYDAQGAAQGRPYEHPWDDDGPYWNLRGNGGVLSTAADMFRWHAALAGDEILSDEAKAKLFEPYVDEGGGDTFYGYGWVVEDTDEGGAVWHNGGNSRSYAEYWRFLDQDLTLFWVTNQEVRDGRWELGDLEEVVWDDLAPWAWDQVEG